MNLKELQEKQRELDNYIIKKRDITFQGKERILSLFLSAFSEIQETENDIENPEEWIDILHFVLSIANELDIDLVYTGTFNNKYTLTTYLDEVRKDLTKAMDVEASYKFWKTIELDYTSKMVLKHLLQKLCVNINQACNFIGEDLETQYLMKHQKNIDRQINGY